MTRLPSIWKFVLGVVMLIGSLRAAEHDVDFRNFTYPLPLHPSVPDHLRWMNSDIKTQKVNLTRGQYESQGSTITLDEILFGYVTMSKQSDAMVVLTYHTGGTAQWKYVYVFNFTDGDARLIDWFETGSRADAGLYRIYPSNGEFTIDLFDPDAREGDCCSTGYISTIYKWQNGKFVVSGKPKHGHVQ
jgi:hypothetical protein